MSWINAGEVYYMLARKNGAPIAEQFLIRLPSLPLKLVLPTSEDIINAARLKAVRRLAYADAFPAVLAQRLESTLITGDPELRAVGDVVRIDWLRD